MIKNIIVMIFSFISMAGNAQEFTGCGEYLFKGVLRVDKTSPLKFNYIIHENSQSQMTFTLKEKKDAKILLGILDQPSTLRAKILKMMDRTLGELTGPSEIHHRMSKPLSTHDTEIVKIKDLKCD